MNIVPGEYKPQLDIYPIDKCPPIIGDVLFFCQTDGDCFWLDKNPPSKEEIKDIILLKLYIYASRKLCDEFDKEKKYVMLISFERQKLDIYYTGTVHEAAQWGPYG